MKVYVSSTDWAIVIDLKEATLWEWIQCLKEQYPLKEDKSNNRYYYIPKGYIEVEG